MQVFFTERTGQSGRGFVLQDVYASPEECMDRIRDLANYPKMVPKGISLFLLKTGTSCSRVMSSEKG